MKLDRLVALLRLSAARDFIHTLRSVDSDWSIEVDGRSIGDWLTWAENRLQSADPLANGLEDLFRRIAEIKEFSHRD